MNLLSNIEKIHTTEMGKERIRKNLHLYQDVVRWCQEQIQDPNSVITKKGKNWYITTADSVITVNASSYTIITAHPWKKEQ